MAEKAKNEVMMTKLRLALGTFGLAAALIGTGGLHAHGMDMDGSKAMEMRGGMMGEMKMEDMKAELGLSDEQMTKMKAIHKGHKEAMETLEKKLKSEAKELRGLVEKKASDEKLKAGVAAVKASHNAMMQMHKKHHEEMMAILSPLQQAKMVVSMCDHMNDGMMGEHEGKGDDKEDEKEKDEEKGKGK